MFFSFMKMNPYDAAECCVLHMGCFYVLFHNLGDFMEFCFSIGVSLLFCSDLGFGICSKPSFFSLRKKSSWISSRLRDSLPKNENCHLLTIKLFQTSEPLFSFKHRRYWRMWVTKQLRVAIDFHSIFFPIL